MYSMELQLIPIQRTKTYHARLSIGRESRIVRFRVPVDVTEQDIEQALYDRMEHLEESGAWEREKKNIRNLVRHMARPGWSMSILECDLHWSEKKMERLVCRIG